MKPQHRIVCRACNRLKILFLTEDKALNFIRWNAEEIKKQTGRAPIRAYYCEKCGGWHVTSQPKKWFTKPDYSIPLLTRKLNKLDQLLLDIYDIVDESPTKARKMCNRANLQLQKICSRLKGEDDRKRGMQTMLNNLINQLI